MDLHETRPDLYVRVFDASGATLLGTTEDRVRKNAELKERIDVRIPRTRLAHSRPAH